MTVGVASSDWILAVTVPPAVMVIDLVATASSLLYTKRSLLLADLCDQRYLSHILVMV
jgi:hypothetical protein